jgi:hypothetical protein
MVWRSAVLVTVATAIAGCAQEPGTAVFGYQVTVPAEAAGVDPQIEAEIRKKTLGSKVLAAIALERVTGRKPDPARLMELN